MHKEAREELIVGFKLTVVEYENLFGLQPVIFQESPFRVQRRCRTE